MAIKGTGARTMVATIVMALAVLHSASCDSSCPEGSVQVGTRCTVQSAQTEEPPDTTEVAAADSGAATEADASQREAGEAGSSGSEAMDSCVAVDESCDKADNDCDGNVDEGCECSDGEIEACAGEERGECRPGRRLCSAGKWGACTGRIEPKASESACDGKDEDCDGVVDDDAPCPAGTACSAGRCQSVCDPDECARTGTICQPRMCAAGSCVNAPVASPDTPCQSDTIPVGYCDAGSCARDTKIVCRVGSVDTDQLMFTDTYLVAAPSNVDNPASSFSCRTERTGHPITWDIFGDFQNDNGVPVEAVYPRGKDTVCSSGGVCAKWFGNPRAKGTDAIADCFMFDDDRTNRVGPVRQALPSEEGMGHPANPDGRPHATMCSPEHCRKWLGDCRLR